MMRTQPARYSSNPFVSPLFGVLEVSQPLAAIIGVGQASRLEATERLHAYVAKRGLSRGDGTVALDPGLKVLFVDHPDAGRFEKRDWVTDAELFEAVARNLN
jgi:chromatin remodeling complex protein RSC6